MMDVAPNAMMVATASTSREAQPSPPNRGAARGAPLAGCRAVDMRADSRSLAIMDALLAHFFQLRNGVRMLVAEPFARRDKPPLQFFDIFRGHDAVVPALRHQLLDQLAILGHGFLPLPRSEFRQHVVNGL